MEAPAQHGPSELTGLVLHPQTPRSLRVHEAALASTRELLREGGLAAAVTDAISARSGVSKATLYKHWPSRIAIAAEAYGRDMAEAVPESHTGSALGDIRDQVRRTSALYASPEGLVYRELVGACATDAGGAAYFRAYFLAGRRMAFKRLWQRAVEGGEVRGDVDADIATDVLFGPLLFRLMTGYRPLTPGDADAITDAALHGLVRQPPPTQED